MEKEFVPYEVALKLKALGFDRRCFGFYKDFVGKWSIMMPTQLTQYEQNNLISYIEDGWLVSASTFSQAFRWFRENHNLFGQVNIHTYFIYDISNDELKMVNQYDKLVKTYEEAELSCLEKLIEIVESKTE